MFFFKLLVLKKVIISALILNIGLLLGRISGFARETFVAATFGVSSEADITLLMLTVPDLLINILVGGSMSAVLIPEFTRNPNNAKILLYQSSLLIGIVFIVISIILHYNSNILINFFAPGFSGKQKYLATTCISWVIWLLPLTVLAGIMTAYLHSNNKFAVASFGTLLINTCIILGIISYNYINKSLIIIAISVLIGGSLRLLSQIIFVKLNWKPISSLKNLLLTKDMFLSYVTAVFSGSILLVIPILVKSFSSYLGGGSLAIMNYTIRLIDFPLVLGISVISVSLFPRLSESFVKDYDTHKKIIIYGCQSIIGVSSLILIALFILKNHYVSVIFNYGNMKAENLIAISNAISIGLFTLPFQGISVFLSSVFYSQKNTKTPLLINFLGLVVFILTFIYNIFGSSLNSILMCMVFSYIITFIIYLSNTAINNNGIIKKIFKIEYFVGLIGSSLFLCAILQCLNTFNLNSYLTLFIGSMFGISAIMMLCLSIKDIRIIIRNKFVK